MTVGDVGKYYQDFFEDFSMEKFESLPAELLPKESLLREFTKN